MVIAIYDQVNIIFDDVQIELLCFGERASFRRNSVFPKEVRFPEGRAYFIKLGAL